MAAMAIQRVGGKQNPSAWLAKPMPSGLLWYKTTAAAFIHIYLRLQVTYSCWHELLKIFGSHTQHLIKIIKCLLERRCDTCASANDFPQSPH